MKALAALLIVVAGLVTAFAIYTFGYRDNGGDKDRTRALAYAQELEAYAQEPGTPWRLTGLARVSDGLWRARFARGSEAPVCMQLHLDRFAITSPDERPKGASQVPCKGTNYEPIQE